MRWKTVKDFLEDSGREGALKSWRMCIDIEHGAVLVDSNDVIAATVDSESNLVYRASGIEMLEEA